MKRNSLAFLLTLFFYTGLFAQDRKMDSLFQLLNRSADDTGKVMLYLQLGSSVIYQNPPDAIPYFNKGLTLAKKLNFFRGLERCYVGISTANAFNAMYDAQLLYIDSAIIYARKLDDPDRLALIYNNKADALCNMENFSAALKNCDTALSFAEKTNNKDRLGRIHYVIGEIFKLQQQYRQAEASLDKAQLFFEQAPNKQMLAMCYSFRADIYEKIKRYNDADLFNKRSIQTAQSVNDISNLSAYTSQYAYLYLAQKKLPEAKAMALQSLNYAKETENIMQESVVHDILCNIYKEQKNYALAIEEGLKAYKILDENNEFSRKIATASTLADLYQTSGNLHEAYRYLKISRELNDSLVKQYFNDETARLQTRFDVAQKNKEIQLLNKDKELQKQKLQKQQLMMIAAVILALLALSGIWLLMNRNRMKQRMKELELRNQIAADLHDEVGSSLSSIHMLSQMANQGNEQTQKDILSRMSSNAKETMDKMGDIVWMIKPGESESASLKQRIERFTYEVCNSMNIEPTLELDELEKIKLSMQQRKNIYLVFKEALNNAAKYSGTDKIEIKAQNIDGKLNIIFKDHGKGFDTTTAERGNGLQNMKNRATEMGGKINISSVIGEGTTVQLSVPV